LTGDIIVGFYFRQQSGKHWYWYTSWLEL